jgi:hypothetical protein
MAALNSAIPAPPAFNPDSFSRLIREESDGYELDAKRRMVEGALADLEARNRQYEEILNEVVDGLIVAMAQVSLDQAPLNDVDDIVDKFEEFETEHRQLRAEFEQRGHNDLRWLVRVRPEATKLMNDAFAGFLARFDRLGEIYRDLRWKLMAAQATLSPSDGVGKIHGKLTDLAKLPK